MTGSCVRALGEGGRAVVFDVETTGLDPSSGDRIVEVGCLELVDFIAYDSLHFYCNPRTKVGDGAYKVHGLSNEFLSGYPTFSKQVNTLLDFIQDSPLVIHNAPFDMRFINNELALSGKDPISYDRVEDTLALARAKFPNTSNSLDALCKRFKIDNKHREKHDALGDVYLLAKVYLKLHAGEQKTMSFNDDELHVEDSYTASKVFSRDSYVQYSISEAEEVEHMDFVRNAIANHLWKFSD